jgi:hypothetical protein
VRTLVPLALVALFVAGAEARSLTLPQQRGNVDLASQANIVIRGALGGDQAGNSVAAAGDVNGDGLGDIVVGAPGADNNGRQDSGSAYVVFGQASPTQVDLATLGSGGLRIDGAAAGHRAGRSVAGAGDVNGDGRADVVVGAHGADALGRANSGAAYIVFGTGSGATVDLASLGNRGVRIDGAAPSERAGWTVAPAGDVNGDGRPDVLVGAFFADRNQRQSSGSAYVVFGSTTPSVDLAALGDRGFRIDGAAPRDFAAEAIAPAGDLNGDGKGDVLVGATFGDHNARDASGSAYVVFGKSTGATVDLAALPGQGVRIDGAAPGDGAGAAVAAADVNADGRAEVLVGAPFADNNGRRGSGSVYVVFDLGSSTRVDLAAQGAQGPRIDGAGELDFAGGAVAAVGDANGDARADAVLGAVGSDGAGRSDAGAAYVVDAGGARTLVDLAGALGPGFRIAGGGTEDAAGTSVAGAGDVNGDGRADVVVGAPFADRAGRSNAGAAYVVYGFGVPELVYDPLVATVGRRIALHAPSLASRTGPARFTVSRRLPEGLGLDSATGVVTGTPRVYTPTRPYVVTMTDLTSSVRAALRITITDRRAPRLTLGGPRIQDVDRRNAVTVRAACDERCRLVAAGAVVGAGGPVTLRAVRRTLAAPGATTLRLTIPAAARMRLGTALDQGRRVRAIVEVHAVDPAGNASHARRAIVLRG